MSYIGSTPTLSSATFSEALKLSSSNDLATGADAALSTPTSPVIRLTNASLTSLAMIPAVANAVLLVTNVTGANITIKNDTGATAANRILTGEKANITLKDEATMLLSYDSSESRWMVMGIVNAATAGGSGDVVGPASSVDGEIALFDSTTGKLLKRMTGSGFVKVTSGVASVSASVALGSEVSGTLPVANGGTGAASFTANNVLLGNGTSAFQVVAPGTSGNVLKSNGTTWISGAPDAPTNVVAQTSATGSAVIPSGTTGQRDGSPVAGYFRWNSTLSKWEGWTGSTWKTFTLDASAYIVATGGTITTDGNDKIHTFTSSGTFTITDGPGSPTVQLLVVGGGGGGGGSQGSFAGGGGGGAGGYRTVASHAVSITSYSVTVGAGGTKGSSSNGTQGGSSTFDSITSAGGGYGTHEGAGAAGGSGGSGGGASSSGQNAGAGNTPSTSPAQGKNGYRGNGSNGGAGGGSTGGAADLTSHSTTGGAGTSNSISGSAVTYAAGGDGGIYNGGTNGANGTANRGNGGGGSSGNNATDGGNGGSGIVIIRYQYQA